MLKRGRQDNSALQPEDNQMVRPMSRYLSAASKWTGPTNLWMNRPGKATKKANACTNINKQDASKLKSDVIIQNTSSGQASTRCQLNMQSNNNRKLSSASEATSEWRQAPSALWMNHPADQSASPTIFESIDNETDTVSLDSEPLTRPTLTSGRVTGRTRVDLQTNNSRREGMWGAGSEQASSSAVSDDYEIVSDFTEPISLENTSAVAKGADAMVKNSLSRPTEIIDTSKLIEEGKVSTEYVDEPEIIEEQDRAMIDEYEKLFAYARRLRALLNMKFRELDKAGVETNFLLIKAHEHPTQRMIDRWRNVDMGVSYNDQVKRQKQIEDYKANAMKKKGKKGDEPEPVYPDLIRFTVRFRKDNSEKRWKDYMTYRKNQKKMGGGKGAGPVPKPNDKYVFAFLDIWSYCVVVFVKPSANVRDIVEPVFTRVGLERRADFTYTIGCFNNDKRAGKAKIIGVPNGPEPVDMYELASELYKKNCTEIYVNDNRCEMFGIFPTYYNPALANQPDESNNKKKKKGKDKGGKNKSNALNASNLNGDNDKVDVSESIAGSGSGSPPTTPVSATRFLHYEANVFETRPASSRASAVAGSSMRASRHYLNPVEETSRESQA